MSTQFVKTTDALRSQPMACHCRVAPRSQSTQRWSPNSSAATEDFAAPSAAVAAYWASWADAPSVRSSSRAFCGWPIAALKDAIAPLQAAGFQASTACSAHLCSLRRPLSENDRADFIQKQSFTCG